MERVWASRLRWRLRGAWLAPLVALLTLADALLIHWRPLAGDGPRLVRRRPPARRRPPRRRHPQRRLPSRAGLTRHHAQSPTSPPAACSSSSISPPSTAPTAAQTASAKPIPTSHETSAIAIPI